MKDLAFCIEFVEHHSFVLSAPGFRMLELYAPLYETPGTQITTMPLSLVKTITYHRFSKKTFDFWHCVVRLMAQYIGKEIKAMLRVLFATHFFALLVYIVWVLDTFKSADTEPCNIESNRDPPKIFIPIPKIESHGCARSDLTIRSLIF
ncbi:MULTISPECIES: hypothetical protein [unclassified Microcoleus]|uniref:hypothetical protein n=1 Tax=unclassified Microcoleus TaxID=2642155 RepID=UPI002FD6918B